MVVAGGEVELGELLDRFPDGVEETDGGFAVYADEAGEAALRARFVVTGVDDVAEGWEDSWRSFHHGVVVGRFWVGPPWEAPPAGLETIVVDPGRAFGTGAHPTTRLTLELLQEQPPGSLLDVGCGSGVLSIAAVKLGFAPVVAIDIDAAALEVSLENANANGVTFATRRADGANGPLPAADVVLANVALDVVEALLRHVAARRVVASGYLDRDEPGAPDWRSVDRRAADGWAADVLERVRDG